MKQELQIVFEFSLIILFVVGLFAVTQFLYLFPAFVFIVLSVFNTFKLIAFIVLTVAILALIAHGLVEWAVKKTK